MKYTKKQKDAIDSLLCYLDELEDKPRRLFWALQELAIAFDKKEAIPSLREAQEQFYKYLTEGEKYDLLFDSLREFKIQT